MDAKPESGRMKLERVNSSMAFEIGYDADSQIMAVRYRPTVKYPAGQIIEYVGVPEEVYGKVRTAPSIGRALHQFVRGIYEKG